MSLDDVDQKRFTADDVKKAIERTLPFGNTYSLRDVSAVVVREALINRGAADAYVSTWGIIPPNSDFASEVVKQVVSGEQWADMWAAILKRCLSGEKGMRIYITVGTHGPDVFLCAPTSSAEVEKYLEDYDDELGRLAPETEVPGGPLDDVELEKQKEGQEKRVFEIGEAVSSAVTKLKVIDFAKQSNTH
jgi:hypothetical protein